ncbi:hypothetical protein JNUCC64_04850 [Streptomyces sp. JNUCC 64]
MREGLLNQERDIGDRHELSSRDHGLIAELNWLAARTSDPGASAQRRLDARAEFSALVDRSGLRPVSSESEGEVRQAEWRAVRRRHFATRGFLSSHAKHLANDLARPVEYLSSADAAALRASREAALLAERRVEAFIGGRDITTVAAPGYDENGLPLSLDGLAERAGEWARHRTGVSARAAHGIEEHLAAGEFPLRAVMIGGGASLTGRDPDALLVDAVGRWHEDPAEGIVQSADQARELARTMKADLYGVVPDPRHRIPLDAVRAWVDELATRGDVVNGRARLRLGQRGELLAEITPADRAEGAPPLWVACDGAPVVATGLPPEVVPGIARDRRGTLGVESRAEALRLLDERLGELVGQGAEGAGELRGWLAGAGRHGVDTRTVWDALEGSPLNAALRTDPDAQRAARLEGCFTTLAATRDWEGAREEAPGRALMGDEVADGRFDPRDARHWIVAGSGGTGVANAEIILKGNPESTVTIIGRQPPPAALDHQVQYPAMKEKYLKEDGTGRLRLVEADLGAVRTARDEDGRAVFRVPYPDPETGETRFLEGDGYVANLGRTNPLPGATQLLADEVRDRGGRVSGDLLFDGDDQYLGYGLSFAVDGREHRVDVTGAASWQLPREVFPPESGLQGRLNAMGARALPAETGNALPGFAPTARQGALRAKAVARATAGDGTALRRTADVPERWRGPGPEAGPTGSPASGPTPPLPEAGPERGKPSASTAPADLPAPPRQETGPRSPGPAASTPGAPEAPAPAPASAAPPASVPPAPARPAWTGPALWHTGIPRPGAPRPATAPPPPERPPPAPRGPATGTGLGE